MIIEIPPVYASITNLNTFKEYFVEKDEDCKDDIDRSAYRQACRHGTHVQMGKVCINLISYEQFCEGRKGQARGK